MVVDGWEGGKLLAGGGEENTEEPSRGRGDDELTGLGRVGGGGGEKAEPESGVDPVDPGTTTLGVERKGRGGAVVC